MVKNKLESFQQHFALFLTVLRTPLLKQQEFLQSLFMSDRVMRGQTVHLNYLFYCFFLHETF
jgi:hypothetical protein